MFLFDGEFWGQRKQEINGPEADFTPVLKLQSSQGFISATYWICKIESAHFMRKSIGLLLLLGFTFTKDQEAPL